ncbi:MAG: RagB/SusD family nutrient uptake outer membrane protein [Tannerellaceae bacterium]|nr:RagB/SusD family nutrient uptake outer membrane protein [Tannerellaceae bacterium]
MRNYIYNFLIISLFAGFTACELNYDPLDGIAGTTNWQSEDDVVRGVNEAYRFLSNVDEIQAFISCATDDNYSRSNWPCDVQYIGNGSATASTTMFSNVWAHYYKMVTACNDLLDNIDRVTTLSEANRNRYTAEVRVIRAYAYQQLTGLYGDVPLITSIPEVEDFLVPRTPLREVVDFIANELKDITTNGHLPQTWPGADEGRVTEGTALALLARTMLYNGRWEEAAAAAEKLINSGVYEIDANYLSVFDGTNKQSREIILKASHLKNVYPHAWGTWLGSPSLGGWSQVSPLKGLVDAYLCTDGKTIDDSPLYDPENPYENRDPRLKMSIAVPGTEVNGQIIDVSNMNSMDRLGAGNASRTGYYYKKYFPADVEGNWDVCSYNDIILIRYAEVLLVYAEAKIESGSIDQSVLDAINQVRGRPGVQMPLVTTTNPDELREIVRRERRVEFPVEDHRLFDIRRWKIAGEVMNQTVYGIFNSFDPSRSDYGSYVVVESRRFNPDRDYLWAIPLNEIGLNPNLLPNNPGW